MELIELNIETREMIGSTAIGRMRREGNVPGVIYSEGKEALNVLANELHFKKKTSGV